MMNGVRILAIAVFTFVVVQSSPAQTASSECKSETISVPFLTKPGEGWDVSFLKQTAVLKSAPFLLSDGKDSGIRAIEYEPTKLVITLPHIEVDPCKHSGVIREWHLVPKQIIGFEKNGHLFAYQLWVQMISGPKLDSQVLGSNTHVIFYDMTGSGIFDSVRLGAGVGMPMIPEWVQKQR